MTQVCPVCNNEMPDDALACPTCGYHALGATQSFKPVQFGTQEFAAVGRAPHAAFLKIVRGPQTGIELALKPGTLTIGRDPNSAIFLNDMTVSRKHAVVEVSNSGTVIRDQDSFNGVWVNNKNVSERKLADGDVIQIGEFCLLYQER